MKTWNSSKPEKCQLCQGPLDDKFVDGVVRGRGWAIMHPECHAQAGVGLGTGMGQLYERRPEGHWVKIAG